MSLLEFEVPLEAILIHDLWNTIQQAVLHSQYPIIHLLSNISVSILSMSSGDNLTTNISELLHIGNVKEV